MQRDVVGRVSWFGRVGLALRRYAELVGKPVRRLLVRFVDFQLDCLVEAAFVGAPR